MLIGAVNAKKLQDGEYGVEHIYTYSAQRAIIDPLCPADSSHT